jgi:hypothetical protein
MARAIERWFVCNGPYRIRKPVRGHPERIIEIEDVDRHERFHGSRVTGVLACARVSS